MNSLHYQKRTRVGFYKDGGVENNNLKDLFLKPWVKFKFVTNEEVLRNKKLVEFIQKDDIIALIKAQNPQLHKCIVDGARERSLSGKKCLKEHPITDEGARI